MTCGSWTRIERKATPTKEKNVLTAEQITEDCSYKLCDLKWCLIPNECLKNGAVAGAIKCACYDCIEVDEFIELWGNFEKYDYTRGI